MSKVLILINNDIGLYKFRKELIKRLLKNHEVYISLPDGPYIRELINMGCKFIDTPINRRGTNPLTDFKLILNYRQILTDLNPDIVLSYTIKPNVYGGLMSRFYNVPYITTVTGLGSAVKSKGFLQKIVIYLYKVSLKKAHKIFFQNDNNYNFFKENNIIDYRKAEMVAGSGVNLEKFVQQDYPEERKVINLVFIGRLMKDKGISELFEAANYFKKSSNKINFHVLGFFEDDLEETVEKLDNEGVIEYHGQQSDIRPFLKESHAIIHPSYHEGLSNVLLEAAASGRPILASDIPGCRETFDEGVTGFGFKAQSAESLIDTIEKFIELPYERKKKMGILGRRKIEKEFDRQKVVDAYINEIKNKN